jgi:AraC family transcriptional regulator of adaptative response/methylated-DNA-[protein]-cysteine methyltransferase
MATDLLTARTGFSPFEANDDERWLGVVRRDDSADGVFHFSVSTTGVYCRPACAARLPRREDVRFHASREDAEHAGFRPCKRCRRQEATVFFIQVS